MPRNEGVDAVPVVQQRLERQRIAAKNIIGNARQNGSRQQ